MDSACEDGDGAELDSEDGGEGDGDADGSEPGGSLHLVKNPVILLSKT